jgi:ABC-2 type transport system ATP-binding protein
MIEAQNLTKRYGEATAVNDLTFTVKPGIVTGFLGPNGSGKSTTMRLILGLDAPTGGEVRVNGKRYAEFQAPLHEVGALLEARSVHTGRSAYNHLLALAQTHGIPRRRVEEVIEIVGLESVARKRAGQFSLGMGQRLGIAAALLGDPDHLIVIGRGRLIADVAVDEFIRRHSRRIVVARSPQATELAEVLAGPDVTTRAIERELLEIEGLTAEQIGTEAFARDIVLYELTPKQTSLEEAFMSLTRDEVEYQAHTSTTEARTGALAA